MSTSHAVRLHVGAFTPLRISRFPARASKHQLIRSTLIWNRVKYIFCVYTLEKVMTKAKLFRTGGSQAVRLPAEFRFEGDEVDIKRDAATGDVVLSKPIASWDEYFAWVRTLKLPQDLLERRDQPQDEMRDVLKRRRRG